MIIIPIEEVEAMQKIRNKVNRPHLRNIVFTRKGKALSISKEIIDEWEMTGLNNCDFITSGAYKQKKVRYDT